MADRSREDDELDEVIGEITRVIETGERIDTEAYYARYPALGPGLKQFFKTRMLEAGDRETGVSIGSVIDDYRIVREIGRGGMGVVYEAEQLSMGRRVALKVMPPGLLAGKSAFDRFRREATAVARLSHPRIVSVHGFNQAGGVAYLAMELVPGLDLGEIVDRLRTARTHGRRFVLVSGPHLDEDVASWAKGRRLIGTMPGDARLADGIVIDLRNYAHMAAAIAADAADALHHAHAHGIVHRDIKPGNLILAPQGRVKLTDFGLAKSVADGSLTKTGDFVGSPAYVAPEQAGPRRRKVDLRADVYSLGVTLYELLTLHQPFAGKDVAVILRNILTKDPPPPTQLNPRIPKDLETIVLKAMEKDPDRRYQTAEALADDLRRFLNFEAITARPPGALSRVARGVRRHRTRLALSVMGAVIVALSALLATGILGARHRGDVVVRDISELLSARGSHPATEGVLELVSELSQDLPLDERRRRIDMVTENARQLLEQDHYARVDELLERLDAKTALGRWSDLERTLLENRILEIKIALVARLQRTLTGSAGVGLSATRRRDGVRPLERLLLDPDPLVCKNAAVALAEVAESTSLGALVDALAMRTDSEGKEAVVDALGALGDPDAVPFLLQATRDGDADVRYAAMAALERLAPPDLPARLAHLSDDPEPWVSAQYRSLRERWALGGPR